MVAELVLLLCLLGAEPAPQPAVLGLLPDVQKRYLFTYPRWWDDWLNGNFSAAKAEGRELPITGVLVFYVDTPGSEQDESAHAGRVKKEVHDLGLKYVHGVRHSHQTLLTINEPLTRSWQESAILRLNMVRWPAMALDCEPYYLGGPRHHNATQWGAAALACQPWSESLVADELWVYPANPTFSHTLSIMGAAHAGGTRVFALDRTTYHGSDAPHLTLRLAQRNALWHGFGFTYVPGFDLYWLTDADVMGQVGPRVWFFPRPQIDDLPNFGTPSWNPLK